MNHCRKRCRATLKESEEKKVYKVAELTRLIKQALENGFGSIWVEGELSNVRQPSSGHYYFTVKDEMAQISAVLFKGSQRGLKFVPADGMQVRVFGEISVYEKGGNYQIIIRQMEEAGQGALQAKFEALKRKLLEEGLFDEGRKRPIPALPQHIGIVTSPTGAAIRDILNVISRRFPNLHLVIAPARVQGEGAAEEIALAIDLLNEWGGLDVMIVCRGGGSLEDLWCFNEEVVARAIVRSAIPVISAVGHEIDFTISDFAADLRAPTPSAAAEMVVGRKEEFQKQLLVLARRLSRSVNEYVAVTRGRLTVIKGSYVFREPVNMMRQYLQRLDNLEIRLSGELMKQVAGVRQMFRDLGFRMMHVMSSAKEARVQDVKRLSVQLRALGPVAVLSRGYSITSDERGRIIRSAQDVRVGGKITTMTARGSIESEVNRRIIDNKDV